MKVLKRLCTFLLGTSLVAGGLVALNSKKAEQTGASEAVGACCDLSANIASVTGYSKEHTYGDYKVYGGQNNNGGWAYFKFGGKKAKAADPAMVTEAYVKGTTACSYDIKRIDVVLLAGAGSTSTVTITMDADIASSADFSDKTTTTSTSVNQTVATTLSIEPDSGTSWGANKYYCVNFHISNNTTTNGVLFIQKINFIYESATPRGDISVDELSNPVLTVGSSTNLSYTWTPASGSGATISSYSYTSSDSDVLSVSGDQITAVAPGVATVTLNATDSLSESYEVVSEKIIVTNAYDFEVGDNVALYSESVLKELSGINKSGSTHYGDGVDYSTTPNGTYLLNVEEGSLSGSFAFKKGDDYLAWSSGNSLTSSTTKSENTSWFVVAHNDYMQICNASMLSREIYWNNGSPRFACYEGKAGTSGYSFGSLIKIDEAPVRGTLAISSPTDKVMRGDATGSLVYEWTPNSEAPSVTIASHAWSSSDTAVISVSGDTYTAEGPGKAKLTLTATDSTGQEYTVVGSEIEVKDVVSGSLVKKTSVSVGDTITFVCESEGTQLSGIASNIGQYVFYSTSPADIFMFQLEEGSEIDSFALKHDDKYLSWTGHSSANANIGLVDTVDEYASWTITFDEGNAIVSNVGLDGESHRYIAWNHGSPRFAAYKTGQTAIQLYAVVTVYDADAFAQDLLDQTDVVCGDYMDGDNNHDPLVVVWSNLASDDKYGSLSSDQKTILAEADRDEGGTVVEQAMARYDYLTGKYNLNNFITGRTPMVVAGSQFITPVSNSNSSTIIIVVVALTSITSIGVLLVIKRKRSLVK